LNSLNTYEGVKEIGRLSLPLRTVMGGSPQIQKKRPTLETSINRQDPSARTVFCKYRLKTQVTHSPLILKQLGEGLKRSGKTNQQGQTVSMEKFLNWVGKP
jgi:hypothetical protein